MEYSNLHLSFLIHLYDEPSDACSRTDEDGAKGSWDNKRKSTQACSYPNKKHGFVIKNEWECFVICVFAAVVLILIYLFTEEDEEEDEEEGDDEDEDEDKEARADLIKVTVDCFIATKAWAELELGPGNTNIEEILGMLRLVPGYDEAAVKAKQEATKAKKRLEFL